MANAGADSTIRAGDHILAADQLGVADETLGDEIGMLDKIAAMADNAGNQCCVFGQLYVLKDAPFMLVAGIRCLDRVAADLHAEKDIDHIFQRNVVMMRAMETSSA